jgi:DNA-binding winged helix-turn-helix (wHTH) protein/WD40 repeat protein
MSSSAAPETAPSLLRFGVFEADLRTGELRKQGRRIHLQDLPFRLLALLLRRANELVTKEEIRRELWPDTPFIDLDHSVSVAINRIRDVLDDSADSPRFVESVARRGYRFIADVQPIGPQPLAPVTDAHVERLREQIERLERERDLLRREFDQYRADEELSQKALQGEIARLSSHIERLRGELTARESVIAQQCRQLSWHRNLIYALLALLIAGAGIALWSRTRPTRTVEFHRITYRRGSIMAARFVRDANTVIYGAAWDGNRVELFSTRPDNPESRSLGLADAEILSISSGGDMALLLHPRFTEGFIRVGTLARMPITGGAPRPLLEQVEEADWNTAGTALAIVRNVGGKDRLEYPVGKVLYETAGFISNVRFSPNGGLIAFIDHPFSLDDFGSIDTVDTDGRLTVLSADWLSARGLAWSRDGREVWFTATRTGIARALYAVGPNGGKERLISRVPGTLTLLDVARDGRVLLTQASPRFGLLAIPPGEKRERELSWHDYSVATDVTAGGQIFLFNELGEGGGQRYAVYLRRVDGSPAVRLGDGAASAISPDGQWVLSKRVFPSYERLVLLPTGPGDPKPLAGGNIRVYHWGTWLPDGKRLLLTGNEAGHPVRLWLQDVAGGPPRPISPEGVRYYWHAISPDGRFAAAKDPEGRLRLYSLNGSTPQSLPQVGSQYEPIRFSADGQSLFVFSPSELPVRIYRMELRTGRLRAIREIAPSDPAGILRISWVQMSPAGDVYGYTYCRWLADLYVAEQLK